MREMRNHLLVTLLLVLIGVFPALASDKTVEISLESGLVLPGYNTIQSPNDDSATRFSLSDMLDIESKTYIRARVVYNLSERHHLSLLYAPLSLDASGVLPSDVRFEGAFFPKDTFVNAVYRFDSYRLTYRYDLVRNENLTFSIGLTAKIRDAEIALNADTVDAKKTNTGFVPLLNFHLKWLLTEGMGILFEADALAAKQGRAEDVYLAWFASLGDSIELRLGYRMVEGGANVDEVYSFALINYLAAGISFKF